jgi:KDO2-lipid IV(A) lauroyltransferase
MTALSFYLLLPLLYFLSVLPMKVLYVVSDFVIYPLLYTVFKYRKKVVAENLRNSFPEKTNEERLKIEIDFYHHLSDLFIEIIKGFTISKKELTKRVLTDKDLVLVDLYNDNKNVILTVGHYGNYEWGCMAIPQATNHKVFVPYRQLTNKYFDKLFKTSREKLGVNLFHTHKTRHVLDNLPDVPVMIGLANDQAAPPKKSYWVKFLNQETSFFNGTEKIAVQKNIPVYFGRMIKHSRGFYQMDYELITMEPTKEPVGFIMQRHAEMLEKDIIARPEMWLWTHRRWKHKMPEGYSYGFNE